MQIIRVLMRRLARLVSSGDGSEGGTAVQTMYWLERIQDWGTAGPLRRTVRRIAKGQAWPIVPGAYQVGMPGSPVAVCTLTSKEMIDPLVRLPGVAIVGRVYTVNLGIEKIILNVTSNPVIRALVVCGRDSPIFQPAQALEALFRAGVTEEHRIVGAKGHMPTLRNVSREQIARFRNQVEYVDLVGETGVDVVAERIAALISRNINQGGNAQPVDPRRPKPEQFKQIRPGGRREPLSLDPKGFFVIALDHAAGEMIVRHYFNDNTPSHEIRGRSAESMLLGLLRAGLISELSHAGYLGAELAKAEASLRLGLGYEQDRPLTKSPSIRSA